jgi:DNA-binding LytR/AlgR family response regulator
MDVKVIEEEGRKEIEVTIRSAPEDPRATRLANRIRAGLGRLIGFSPDGTAHRKLIPLPHVLFVEVRDRRTWVVTDTGERLESPMRLYELETVLEDTEFVRVSRQVIVNLDRVEGIRPEPNGRMVLELPADQYVVVNRSYAADVKEKIGIGI